MQYAALVTQFTAKTRSTLKQLPLPGVSSDAGAVRLTWRPAARESRNQRGLTPCDRHAAPRPLTRAPPRAAPQNELMQLRIRSAKHEIIVAPDHDYTLIVVQGGPPKPT